MKIQVKKIIAQLMGNYSNFFLHKCFIFQNQFQINKIRNNSNDEILEFNRELNIENLSKNNLLYQKDDVHSLQEGEKIYDLFDNPKNPFKNFSNF
jgi:hypothetical protein